jgi:hypothetical protein
MASYIPTRLFTTREAVTSLEDTEDTEKNPFLSSSVLLCAPW